MINFYKKNTLIKINFIYRYFYSIKIDLYHKKNQLLIFIIYIYFC